MKVRHIRTVIFMDVLRPPSFILSPNNSYDGGTKICAAGDASYRTQRESRIILAKHNSSSNCISMSKLLSSKIVDNGYTVRDHPELWFFAIATEFGRLGKHGIGTEWSRQGQVLILLSTNGKSHMPFANGNTPLSADDNWRSDWNW